MLTPCVVIHGVQSHRKHVYHAIIYSYNEHIHVLHYLPKPYIYRYLISNPIISEATIQKMILQNICLLLI